MAPRSSQPSGSQTRKGPMSKTKSKTKLQTLSLDSDLKLTSGPLKRINPLTAFNLPSSQQPSNASQSSTDSSKGKGKAKENAPLLETDGLAEQLWVDKYEPMTEAELAVHVRKVGDVRQWLEDSFTGGPSGALKKYRRILALTGPAGAAKTATVKILARELDIEIVEWKNGMADTRGPVQDNDYWDHASSSSDPYRGHFVQFQEFLGRAAQCHTIFSSARKRRVILLEELPNLTHDDTRSQFHVALESLVLDPNAAPAIIIISESSSRGEAADERMAGGNWGKDRDGAIDIRTVLSRELLHGPYVTQMRFNPIAPTLMRKALQALLNRHFSNSTSYAKPTKEVLEAVIESSGGDIRSAIMTLQFSCVTSSSKAPKKRGGTSKLTIENVSRREQSLVLYHLMGKLLYNKRKGDPSSASATAKDIQRDKDLDAKLTDPSPLPSYWAEEHARRTSRVDVDSIYSESPIDSSLLSLYIHQNYVGFCNELEGEVAGVSDWLSYIDSSGGEAWFQANPHRFHLLALGTLHSLPSPVQRRGQKVFKPEFFEFLTKEKQAADGVGDIRNWLNMDMGTSRMWTQRDVALELGGVLKARSSLSANHPPLSHMLFSNMPFEPTPARAQQLGENDVDQPIEQDEESFTSAGQLAEAGETNVQLNRAELGGWLENDEIEDFE